MAKYDTNNHSVFLMRYHLILVTKYRRKVITETIQEKIKSIFNRIAPSYNIELLEINGEEDHIHFLFKAAPNTDLSKFINAFKSASSRLIKKEHPEVKRKLWKEYFWSRSFFIATCGDVSMESIRKYIEMQGQEAPQSARSCAREMNKQ